MRRHSTFRNLIGTLALSLLHTATGAQTLQDFRDRDLALLLQSESPGVIYLWSPHMPYSVQGAAEVQRVAHELAVRAVLLLDPHAEPSLTRDVIDSHRLPVSATRKARADVLAGRGATQHFPTVIVFEGGRLDERMLPGYTPPDDLRAYIRQRLNDF